MPGPRHAGVTAELSYKPQTDSLAEMCGRYTISTGVREIEAKIGTAVAPALVGRYNVRPTEQIPIIRRAAESGSPELVGDDVRWGLHPHWSKRPILNARADRLSGSKMWRQLLNDDAARVLIPATGWYEWLHDEGGNKTTPQPYHHTVNGEPVIAFAGILGPAIVAGEKVMAATIVTTDSNPECSNLHDRMPAILTDSDHQQAWLSPSLQMSDLVALCRPVEAGSVLISPASLEVNKPGTEGPELLDPDGRPPQLSLA